MSDSATPELARCEILYINDLSKCWNCTQYADVHVRDAKSRQNHGTHPIWSIDIIILF